ncbi:MAG TPA: PP2C family protein-serine/threonine phosphatase [Bacteroidota bacterium]|nr:PP2C family protein-serine/threonine phosphatase [Bacteroidota bacterium]
MEQTTNTPPRLIRTLRDDIAHGGILDELRREASEIEDFYLDQEERERLQGRGAIGRAALLAWWVVKHSLLRLTSARRILLVLGIVLVFIDITVRNEGDQVSFHFTPLGAACLVLVIILELKDKLLARDELESGRAVQLAMSPEPSPAVPGWDVWLYTRSANEVGGDLVDFLRLDGGRSAAVVGDVAGKGLAAALFMVKIQSTLRALAPDFTSPADLMAKLNAILIRDGLPGKFASLVYVAIDSPSGDIRLVNAGHMPPVIISGGTVTELPKGNAALGLAPLTLFEPRDVHLAPGDTLVVYSDGVTEARNGAGEFFGPDRFKALCAECRGIAAQPFGARILDAVARFEGNARRTDDLSLVILRKAG